MAAREQLLETIDALDYTHPRMASVLVTHHLEELPASTSHDGVRLGNAPRDVIGRTIERD